MFILLYTFMDSELNKDLLGQLRTRWALGLIMLLALVHGALYVFLVPPWQHYDETNHFEYIWLYVDRGYKPPPGDFDTDMRRDVAESMIEHGFFDGMEVYHGSDPLDQTILVSEPFLLQLLMITCLAIPFFLIHKRRQKFTNPRPAP